MTVNQISQVNLVADELVQYMDYDAEITSSLNRVVERLESATRDYFHCLYLAHKLGWSFRRIAKVIGKSPNWTHRHIQLFAAGVSVQKKEPA